MVLRALSVLIVLLLVLPNTLGVMPDFPSLFAPIYPPYNYGTPVLPFYSPFWGPQMWMMGASPLQQYALLHAAADRHAGVASASHVLPDLPPHDDRPSPYGRARLIIVDSKGHVLLGYNPAEKKWGSPGGHVEKGETLEEGALRELKEETNIDGHDVKEMTLIGEDHLTGCSWFRVLILDRVKASITSEHDPDKEFSQLKFFSPHNLPTASATYPDSHYFSARFAMRPLFL
eukprot:c10040_g1_i1.p1 GENE.c10040_g1_i1~~c10040_g1_i1.p1  ORF type:complete len:231 (-),score=55.11 c10040_g1_i1:101-793(-)